MAADQLTIRPCVPADAPALRRIFYDAVHTACAADYTPAQLDAWAPKDYDPAAWAETLFCRTVLAAERDGALLGFGSVGPDGYLDLLYVRPERQGQGLGAALCDALEGLYPVGRETRGWRVVRAQRVERRGQALENFVMEKELTAWM